MEVVERQRRGGSKGGAAILGCTETTVCAHLQVCAYVWWGTGGSLQGREEKRKEITTPFTFCSREILKHEHQG